MLTSLAALALVDSLNPLSIATLVYLLGMPRAAANSAVFVLGTFVVYLVGGGLLLYAGEMFFTSWVRGLPSSLLAIGAIVIGVLCMLYAIYIWIFLGSAPSFKPPKRLTLLATLTLAVVATASDLPTAIPYFAAAGLISESNATPLAHGWMLVGYCTVYVLPLMLLVGLQSFFKQESKRWFAQTQSVINWLCAELLPLLLFFAGLMLAQYGIFRW